MSIRTICFRISLALSVIFISVAANAQGQHPHCLNALSDLRDAQLMLLQHINGRPQTHNEKEAMRQINVVIWDINEASINDGNGPAVHPNMQNGLDAAASLRQCIELLKKAKDELSQEADSRFAKGLRDRSIKNCDAAISFAERADQS